jgi:hypothetical protein
MVHHTFNSIIQSLALRPCQGHDYDSALDAIALLVVFDPVKSADESSKIASAQA